MSFLLSKNRTVAILAILSMCTFSCQKDESVELVNNCKITAIDSSSEIVYYDEEGNITFVDLDEKNISFIYQNDTLTQIMESYSEFSNYDNESSESVVNETTTFELSYSDQIITISGDYTEMKIFLNEENKINKMISSDFSFGEEYVDEWVYIYDGDKLSRLENWDNYSGQSTDGLVMYSYSNITYTGDNITKISFYAQIFSESSGVREKQYSKNHPLLPVSQTKTDVLIPTIEINCTYDDKINPFEGTIAGFFFDELSFFNSNNMMSLQPNDLTGLFDVSHIQTEVSYNYNDDSFPVSIAMSRGDMETENIQITYECE